MAMEVDLYGELMVEATRLGNRLFRNNIGMARYTAESGNVYTVPYGVGGKGGADLIGWTREHPSMVEVVTHEDDEIGPRAIFTALEVKPPGWKPRNKEEKRRHEDQKKFLDAVRASGGVAGFVQSIADYHKLIGHTE
jgi:hypothetical protein